MLNMTLENLHILVVSDDEENRQLLENFLRSHGAQITCCNDGESAYKKTSVQAFSCIVCDVHMPVMGGVELLSKIRHILTCDTPMILISSDAEFIQSDLNYKQAQGFLKRPYQLQSLTSLILAYAH
jgi:CheY-like chemotaxis protein